MICDVLDVPAWKSRMVEMLMQSKMATIELVLLTGHSRPARPSRLHNRVAELLMRKDSIAYSQRSDSCALKDISEQAEFVEKIIYADNFQNTSSIGFAEFEQEIEARGIDLIVSLAQKACRDWVPASAKFGLWYFEHSSEAHGESNGVDIGLYEVLKRKSHVWSRLRVNHASLANDGIIYESCSGVHPLSFRRTRDEHLWKVATFVTRSIRIARAVGPEQFFRKARYFKSTIGSDGPPPTSRLFRGFIIVSFFQYSLWRLLRKIERKFFAEQWNLLFDIDNNKFQFRKFKPMQRSGDHLWADPHVIYRNSKYYVFFEEVLHKVGRGHISMLTITSDGQLSPARTVLERPYHLSYPFLFEWEDQLYMIPETAENRSVELFRCVQFPYDWQHDRTLMRDISAFDATLFPFENRWWMFANVKEQDSTSSWDELHLFYADRPNSPDWTSHPCNPVISDVRYARPAGRIFEESGKYYRPSQDSSYRYGYALNINEVLVLNTVAYRERPVHKFEPDWSSSIRALHTYSNVGQLTVIDGIIRSRRRH